MNDEQKLMTVRMSAFVHRSSFLVHRWLAQAYPLRAGPPMLRRISALLGIVAILGLALLLLWRVYLHHEGDPRPDDSTLVALSSRAA
jgi:hypothetical protein